MKRGRIHLLSGLRSATAGVSGGVSAGVTARVSARALTRALIRPLTRPLTGALTIAGVLATSGLMAQTHPALVLSPPFAHEEGHAFIAPLPDTWPPDTTERQASPLLLRENSHELGPAHALHAQIREQGAGAFSHWGSALIFSTSDNSDPNDNGRQYVVEYRGPFGLGRAEYQPLALRDPFAALAGPGTRAVQAPAVPHEPTLPNDRPRIIWWYTIDALRADTPFAERGGVAVMPALADFARHASVRFENAYATASFTKTSTASMFTGLWPTRHRAMHGVLPVWPDGLELVFDLDARFATLAELLSERGYDTWTHLYSLHVRPGDGMLAGFLHLDLDVHGELPLPVPGHDQQLFVYEHILGVHGPYSPSASARERLGLSPPVHLDPGGTDWFDRQVTSDEARELHEAYLAEAADADLRFAQRVAWLQASGLMDDTLLIVTADHGEAFLEHGLTQHSTSLYEEMVRVPLCIRFPAASPLAALHGKSLPQRVSLADLAPTLLDVTGPGLTGPGLAGPAPPPYELDGRSLLPLLQGGETDPLARDVLLRCSFTRRIEGSETSALFVTDAIVSGTLKAQFGYRIQSSQDATHGFRQGDWIAELFDLAEDPREERNLVAERPQDFLRLMRTHAASAQPLQPREDGAAARAPVEPPANETPNAELSEALRQLGYVR